MNYLLGKTYEYAFLYKEKYRKILPFFRGVMKMNCTEIMKVFIYYDSLMSVYGCKRESCRKFQFFP